MKNYVSPVIFDNEELAEGVYATGSGAGGVGCYTSSQIIHQNASDVGRKDDRFQLNATHNADHNTNYQLFVIKFSKAVKFLDCEQALLWDGDGTDTLRIQKQYWNNPTDNIGLGGLVVQAVDGTTCTIESFYVLCEGAGEFTHR